MHGTLRVENASGVVVLVLRGEHDLSTRPRLGEEINEVLAASERVVVDLSEAEFIDSTVVAAIVHGTRLADQAPGRELALVAAPEATFVMRVLSLVHIEDRVALFASRDEAVRALRSAKRAHARAGGGVRSDQERLRLPS